MPFKSKAQQRFMFATDPKMAKKWASHTKDIGSLPNKVKKECEMDMMQGPPELDPLAYERLPGGLSHSEDPGEFSQDQLMKGIHVEFEHTSDVATAMEIAMDHLMEDPNYYDHLANMEAEYSHEEDEKQAGPKLEDVYANVDPDHGHNDVPKPENAHKDARNRRPALESVFRGILEADFPWHKFPESPKSGAGLSNLVPKKNRDVSNIGPQSIKKKPTSQPSSTSQQKKSMSLTDLFHKSHDMHDELLNTLQEFQDDENVKFDLDDLEIFDHGDGKFEAIISSGDSRKFVGTYHFYVHPDYGPNWIEEGDLDDDDLADFQ